MTAPAFKSSEIKRKKSLVLDSLNQSLESPAFVASRAFTEAVFGEHPYGRHAPGTPESLRKIKRKDIVEFHRTHYTPGNAVLSVVGDISSEELDALIETYLGRWEGGAPEGGKIEAPAGGKAQRIHKQMDISQANIYFGHLGFERSHPDYYTMVLVNYTLGGGGFSSRLMDRVRDDLGLAYGIHSSFSPYKAGGVFYVAVQTKNEAAGQVEQEIRAIIDSILKEGITAKELEDAKSYYNGSFPRRMDTMAKTASLMAQVELHGMGMDYQKEYLDAINSVTLKHTGEAARRHLRPEDAVVSITADLDKAGLKETTEGADQGSKK